MKLLNRLREMRQLRELGNTMDSILDPHAQNQLQTHDARADTYGVGAAMEQDTSRFKAELRRIEPI